MANNKISDAASSQIPIAPKRKRQVPCLDEQERRQRKRAMDREAQRSLREKTKTRIADLERTIEILQKKDSNSVTASLMSEIDGLRTENERLKQIIDNVRSLVGGGVVSRNTVAAKVEGSEKEEDGSPAATSVGGPSLPELPKPSVDLDVKLCPLTDADQATFTEHAAPTEQPACTKQPMSVGQPISFDQSILRGSIDLDGMNLMANTHLLEFQDANKVADPCSELILPTRRVEEQEEQDEEELSIKIQRETTYKAMLQEIFGPDGCSSPPTILYIDNPTKLSQPTLGSPICPMWTKTSEVLGRIFTYRSHGVGKTNITASRPRSKNTEAGLLYLGIKNGWDTIPASEWRHCPALELVKQVDDLAFHRFLKTERLAVGYKCLKLLTYYLNATKQDLDNVPIWLRPRLSQASTKHPIIIDFFAWPSLRTRFLSPHSLLSRSAALSFYYPRYLRFNWPFSFEDTFFYDEISGTYLPSPLFEMYASNLKHWMMDETFYENFPEMRDDIEGDRIMYAHAEA